jgi:hypothetical protein
MKVFKPQTFKISESMAWENARHEFFTLTRITNFYGDLKAVNREIDKLPMAYAGGNWIGAGNGKTFVDGRRTYVHSIPGTEFPFTQQLLEPVREMAGVNGGLRISKELLVNSFQKRKGFPEEKYYNIHHDFVEGLVGVYDRLGLVIFLNDRYEEGEGLNFYTIPNPPHTLQIFETEETVNRVHFFQAEPNTAVLFAGQLLHGQATGGKQFHRQERRTQVVFCDIMY